MRYLLTSAGISNTSIHNALVDLWANRLPNPAPSAFPLRGTALPRRTFRPTGSSADQPPAPCADWVGSRWECWSSPRCPASKKSIGSLRFRRLTPCWCGAATLYLCHWMRQSGLADLLPSLRRDGLCGGERREYGGDPRLRRRTYDDCEAAHASATKRWDWLIFRCFRTWITRILPENSLANAERWAAGVPVPAYAIDDQTAIKVIDGTVEVVSEGHWKLFTANEPKTSLRPAFRNDAIGLRHAVHAQQHQGGSGGHRP